MQSWPLTLSKEELYSRSKSGTSILRVYSFVRVRPPQIPSKSSTDLQKLKAIIIIIKKHVLREIS
jgi:hypothetical protein